MARSPRREPRRSFQAGPNGTGSPTEPPSSERDRVIAAFLALLGEHAIERIGYADIAARAGVSLAELRDLFGSKIAIYVAFLKDVDRKVLAAGDPEMAGEPPRERLFDVLMHRIEVLAPHRPAIRSLLRSTRHYPGLAFALNGLAVRSQRWMLAAADIDTSGPRGAIRAQGMAVLFAGVLRTFIHDEDEGFARTMAALDRALGRAQRWSGFLADMCRFVPRSPCRRWHRRHRRDEDRDFGDEEAVPI